MNISDEITMREMTELATIIGSFLNKNFAFNGKTPFHLSGLLPQLRKLDGNWNDSYETILRNLIKTYNSLNGLMVELSKTNTTTFPYKLVRHPTSPGMVGLIPVSSSFSYVEAPEELVKKVKRTTEVNTETVESDQLKEILKTVKEIRSLLSR